MAIFWSIAAWTGAIWWGCIGLLLFIALLAFVHHHFGNAGLLWVLVIIIMGIAGNFE